MVITTPNWFTVIPYIEERAEREELVRADKVRRACEHRRGLRRMRATRPR